MSYDEADSLLNSSGGPPAFKFLTIGTTHKGAVISQDIRDDTDTAGNVRTFKDGSARKVLVVTVQTDLREDAEDDGRRRFFLKFNSLRAVQKAVQEAGAPGLRPGGLLALQYSADDVANQKRGESAPKLYVAEYKPPSPEAKADGLLGAAAAPAAPSEPFPVAQTAPAPASAASLL